MEATMSTGFSPSLVEVNFDGLAGPTHHYGGLADGNLASRTHAGAVANPRLAALQGLEKMRLLVSLGRVQGWFPPPCRPNLVFLRGLGFAGKGHQILNDAMLLEQVAAKEPGLLSVVYSSSAMWAANSATVTSSLESHDGRLHLTPANLISHPHRALEAMENYRTLSRIFSDSSYFCVHPPLPSQFIFADEGAANHTRLGFFDRTGIDLLVYGREATPARDVRYPARQSLLASQAVARRHGCAHPVFLRQSVAAINAGAFHNDVVAVGHQQVMFYHQQAFDAESQQSAFELMQRLYRKVNQIPLQLIEVNSQQLTLNECVQTYLFNSQLISKDDGSMILIAPVECECSRPVQNVLAELVSDHSNPIVRVEFVDLRQSMANGGGPACLRLRVPLTPLQLDAVSSAYLLNEERIDAIQKWVKQYYRDRLTLTDLADPGLLQEVRQAHEALGRMLLKFDSQ